MIVEGHKRNRAGNLVVEARILPRPDCPSVAAEGGFGEVNELGSQNAYRSDPAVNSIPFLMGFHVTSY